jgi:tRNA pseudouridine55 synthase
MKLLEQIKKLFKNPSKRELDLDPENLPEVLLVDKQKGISSFDVIRNLRGHIGKVKMGHAGTLDPLATGLMLIGLGKGTKQLHHLLGLDKTYIADVMLGLQTDTGDLEGKTLEEKVAIDLDEKDVQTVIESLTGIQNLSVPIYSAIKKDGKPLYWYARNNIPVDVPVKTMKINQATMLDFYKRDTKVIVRVMFDVGSGTYIRSLAEEIGRKLDVPATLADLRRTKIGEYLIEDAVTVSDPRGNKKTA